MEHQNRKHPRLKQYDYSLPGYYHITIHAFHDAPPLSRIRFSEERQRIEVCLTAPGRIAKEQLLAVESRYSYARIDKYVIMPNHIHVILRLMAERLQRERPGVTSIVGAFKSLTTRLYNERNGSSGVKLFQTSFYEEVLRNENAYQECWRYIDENPRKWLLQEEEWGVR